MTKYLILFALAAFGSFALTPVVSRLAVALGALDHPDGRRVHTTPTPRLGGISIYLAMAFATAVAVLVDPSFFEVWDGPGAEIVGLVVAASIILVLGIVDDCRGLGAWTKLQVQILAALVLVSSGFEIEKIFGMEAGWWGIPITVLWVVGITNAFNLIDGLDGLASGIGLIVSTTLLSVALVSGRDAEAMSFVLLAGALTGFLRYNFHPARIFLGDSGSLLLGFMLAAISLQMSNKLSATIAILVPLLALGLPIVDTSLTIARRLLRRLHVARRDESRTRYEFLVVGEAPLFSADRRHIHHRLLDLGLTHRNAVLALYAVSLIFGIGAFLLVGVRRPNHAFLLASFGIASVVGIRRLNYGEIQLLRNGALLPIFDSRLFNRRFLHVFLDLVFVVLAQVATLFLWTQGEPTSVQTEAFRTTLPVTTFLQLGAFVAAGLYRGAYRYTGVADIVRMMKATFLAVGAGLLVRLYLTGGVIPPLGPVLLHSYILLTLVMGARIAFRMASHAARSGRHKSSRRVLLYGAGEAGVLALQELETNPSLEMQPIGFLDDDASRRGQLLRGYAIYDHVDLDRLIRRRAFDEVVISTGKIQTERLRRVGELCTAAGIQIRRFTMNWSEVPHDELIGVVEVTSRRNEAPPELPGLAVG